MGLVEYIDKVFKESSRDESPLFSLKLGSDIIPLDVVAIDLNKKPYEKYLPFNYIYIANRSAYDIELIINDTIRKRISSNTIESFDSEVIKAIHTLKIKNLDTSNVINKNDIEILIQKQKRLRDKIKW